VNRPSKRLNVGLLMTVLAIAVTTAIAVAVIHRIQVSRNAGALARLARAKKQEGNSTEALGLFSRYLSYRPDDAEAQAEFASLLIDFAEQPTATKNDRGYAYSVLETAVRKNPDDLLLRQRLAEWMLRFGRFGDATRELNTLREQVVSAAPKTDAENTSDKDTTGNGVLDLDAIDVLRARALIGQSEFQEAATIVAAIIGFDLGEQDFDAGEASEKTGDNARKASLTLATLLAEKLESPQAASIVLKHLADANPKDTQAWLALARWHQAHGDLAKAAAAVKTAAKLAPNNPEVLFSDLELSIAEKRYDVAEQLANKARELFPNDERGCRGLAAVAAQRQDFDTAVTVLREGLVAQPGKPGLLRMLGDVLLQANRIDEAAETISVFAKAQGDKRPAVGLLQARLLIAQKRWLPAKQKLDEIRPLVAESDQITGQVDILLGQCYEMLGQFDEQLAANQRVLSRDYQSLAARVGVANALVASGKPDAALAEYEAVAGSLPPDRLSSLPQVWNPLLQLRIASEMRRPPAERNWSQIDRLLDALEQSPLVSDAQLALLRSDLLVRQGQSAAAFEILRTYVEANPSNPQLLAALVLLTLREQGAAAAQGVLDKVPVDIANDPMVLTVRAQLAARAPADESAAVLMQLEEKALDLPADQSIRLLSTIASIHRGMGELQQAGRLWRAALKQSPDDLVIRTALFELACEQQNVEKAQAAAEEISRLSGTTSPQGRVAKAAAMVLGVRVAVAAKASSAPSATESSDETSLSPEENSQLSAAQNLLIEAENDRPGWAQIQQLFGEIAALRGDLPTAIERLQQTTRLGPANPAVIRQLVSLLYASERLEETQQTLAMIGPDGLGGLERISAEIDLKAGQFDSAVAQAERSLAGNQKNSARDLLWFGQLLARAGKIDRAGTVLQDAVDADPQRPEGWMALLLIQNATGQPQAAELTLKKAGTVLPPPQRQMFVAQGHEMLGRIDDAESSFREAIAADPGNPTASRNLAAFLIRQGRLTAAREELRAIIAATREDSATKQTQVWARRTLAELTAQTGRYPDVTRALALLDDNANSEGLLATADLALQTEILAARPEPDSWRRALGLIANLSSRQPLSNPQRMQKAMLLEQLGRWDECRDELLSIASAPNTPPTFQALLIEKLLQHKELAAARLWLKTLAERLPDAPIVTALQARLALADNDRAAAVAAARKLMPSDTPTPEIASQQRNLASLLEDLGMSTAADQVLAQFAASSSDGVIARAGFLGRAQRADEALDLLEAAWDKLPLESLLRTAVTVLGAEASGATAQQAERLNRWFEKASREDPDSPTLALVRADFIGTTGSEEQITSTYRALLERKDLSPRQTAVAANNLAFHLAKPATAAEAEKLVAVAVAELGPHPDVLDTRGVVLLAAGKGQEAIADLKEAIVVPTATKYIHLAAALVSEDQLDAARQALAEAKKRGFVTRQLPTGDQQRLRAIEAALGE
jgi:cellulose synthase operon protein C